MQKTRILTNGLLYKVQTRFLWFFWRTVQRPEDLENKDFGGDRYFQTLEEAKNFIKTLTSDKWEKYD